MKVFTFEPEKLRLELENQGWLHIKGGATQEFCAYVSEQVERGGLGQAVARHGITVSKEQFVLDVSTQPEVLSQVFDTATALCGLERSTLTLSERHVNVYAPDASPRPRPHKDRFASQVSIGISVEVPAGSHLVLWPDDDRTVNPLQRPGLQDTLLPEEAPEVTLRGAREVLIADSAGDVQVFPGSSVWHTRRDPAGAVVLYFKLNEFCSDPLGEDPSTALVRDQSLAIANDKGRFRNATARLGRRFEAVTREHALAAGQEWLNVVVCGQAVARITELEAGLLKSIDGGSTVETMLATTDPAATECAILRLVRLGAIDLADAPKK
jgi:hypothetical protein